MKTNQHNKLKTEVAWLPHAFTLLRHFKIARKKKSSDKAEDKKIDQDIEAKLAEASKAYEDWLSYVEQREEEERYIF